MRILLRKSRRYIFIDELIGESGEDELVLIKDLQEDKIRDRILHIDFVEVKRGEDLQTSVPLSILGEAEGVKTAGGILEVLANDIEIRCRPSNLPSAIEIDISNLGLGENLQIKDLSAIDGVTYTSPDDTILVSCVGSASGRSGSDDEETLKTQKQKMPNLVARHLKVILQNNISTSMSGVLHSHNWIRKSRGSVCQFKA